MRGGQNKVPGANRLGNALDQQRCSVNILEGGQHDQAHRIRYTITCVMFSHAACNKPIFRSQSELTPPNRVFTGASGSMFPKCTVCERCGTFWTAEEVTVRTTRRKLLSKGRIARLQRKQNIRPWMLTR